MDAAQRIRARSLRIEGFGPIKATEVELAPLTVLIGRNDVGKSFELLAEVAQKAGGWLDLIPNEGTYRELAHRAGEGPIRLALTGTLGSTEFAYEVSLGPRNEARLTAERLRVGALEIRREPSEIKFGEAGVLDKAVGFSGGPLPLYHPEWRARKGMGNRDYERLQSLLDRVAPVLDWLGATRHHALLVEALRQPAALGDADGRSGLGHRGEGLSAALHDLLLHDRRTFRLIEAALAENLEFVREVNLNARRRGDQVLLEVEVVTRSGVHVRPEYASDGLLLFLAYEFIAKTAPPQALLSFEEPEQGLHPAAMQRLVTLLRELATAGEDRSAQVIATTHSPILLDFLEPTEIQVVTRGDDDETRVTPFTERGDKAELARWLGYLAPGEIWTNYDIDRDVARGSR